MKLKVYMLSHSDFDDYSCYEFIHPNNKMQSEFDQDVSGLIKKHLPLIFSENNKNEVSFSKYNYIGNNTIAELVASKLPELGYINRDEVFETLEISFIGSSIIDRKSEAKRLSNYCNVETIERIIEHNKKITKTIYNRLNKNK